MGYNWTITKNGKYYGSGYCFISFREAFEEFINMGLMKNEFSIKFEEYSYRDDANCTNSVVEDVE